MALNSVAPYSFEQNGLEYSFVTKVGLRYKVYFHEADIIEGITMWWFGFETDEERATPYDNRVELTIVEVLKSFLKQNNDALVYVCSNINCQPEARFRLFNRWFTRYGSGFEKYDINNFDIYGGLICRSDFPDKIFAKTIISDLFGF